MTTPLPEIRRLPVESLVDWDRNPRVNDAAVDKLSRVIERFGFLDPVIARRSDLRLIAGHTRVRVARQQGIAEVPVVLVDLSDDDARDLAVAHNRVAEEAAWDPIKLEALVADGLDLLQVGFEPLEIEALLASLEGSEARGVRDNMDAGEKVARVASFPLHLWPADSVELEALLGKAAGPAETRASVVLRALRALVAAR